MNDIGKASYWGHAGRAEFQRYGCITAMEKATENHSIIIPKKIMMAENHTEMAASPEHPLSGEAVRRITPSADVQGKIKIFKTKLRIATWNVRSLFQAGKVQNVEREMSRLKIDILGISETRWKSSGSCKLTKSTIYYSGNDDNKHKNGVAIILSDEVNKSFVNFIPISDRAMLLQLKTSLGIMNIIQVYAPTADKEDQEVEELYEDIKTALKQTKKRDLTILMGDLNAKIGKGRVDGVVGDFGLGNRNDRGDRLLQFCMEEDFIVTNTFFKLPPRRLYTWTSPRDNQSNIIRNQIDYIMINRRFRNGIKAVKTYPGADVFSDHNPVVADLQVRLKRNCRIQPQKRIDVEKLKCDIEKRRITEYINIETERLKNESTTDDTWSNFKNILIQAQDTIGQVKTRKRKPWMTECILKLMDERRQYKNKNEVEYMNIHRQIRRMIREAKTLWMSEQCREIEEAQNRYDSFAVHRKIKDLTANNRKQNTVLKDKNGNATLDIVEKLNVWKEYINELFNDNRNETPDIQNTNHGLAIKENEVLYAIKRAKKRKAVGPDNIHAETLQVLEGNGLTALVKLLNEVYETGIIPTDWLKSTFITIPKKPKAQRCGEHRIISLMSQVLKILLRVIHSRIYRKIESRISETQFGFRSGLGTREALFAYNILAQRCRDMNVDVYACFIDYEKAFDRVQHDKLLTILKQQNLDEWDIRIIANLYWHQSAHVKVDNVLSEDIEIRRGVRQGCILSPLLFNLYSEFIFSEALQHINEGIVINGVVISNIRYADDTVLLAETLTDLQKMVNAVATISNRYGLAININKTKVMVISKTQKDVTLVVNDMQVEQIQHMKYLGTVVNSQANSRQEILSRIEQARTAFMKLKTLLTSPELALDLRIRIVRCYVFPILCYGMESWTLKQETTDRLQAFEMWIYRRMLRISWMDHVSNNEVLYQMRKSTEIIFGVKKAKLEYLGHIMRNEKYQLLQNIIQGKIAGRRSVGRPAISWLKNLREWYNTSSIHIFRVCSSKMIIANMIANLRRETTT